MMMRGGSSRGLFFEAQHLPPDPSVRDQVILSAIGRDERQIDGLGGADPLTSKVAIVSPSSTEGVDLDFLFVQVVVGADRVDTTPNCGNLLAAVGAFAIESSMVETTSPTTRLVVNMLNTSKCCELVLQTPDGRLTYEGETRIDGVPGTSAPIICNYLDVAGAVCGDLFPTGSVVDDLAGYQVTCIDNGMPVVILRASDFGLSGKESPESLTANDDLKSQLEAIRLLAGERMNLGDVSDKAVPKMCLVSAPRHGGVVGTRTFIPHHCHKAIGVLGAVSVATACSTPGTVAFALANRPASDQEGLSIEHPSGEFTVQLSLEYTPGDDVPTCRSAGVVRSARLLARGELMIPAKVFPGGVQ